MIFIGGFFLGEKPFLRKVFFPRPLFQKFGVVFQGGYYFTMLLAFPKTMGRYKYDGVYSKDCGSFECATYNKDAQTEPFRGIGTRACTIRKQSITWLFFRRHLTMTQFETTIKCLFLPPHPSLRDTFSPRAKAFDGCTTVYTKDIHNVPFRWIATARQKPSLLAMT